MLTDGRGRAELQRSPTRAWSVVNSRPASSGSNGAIACSWPRRYRTPTTSMRYHSIAVASGAWRRSADTGSTSERDTGCVRGHPLFLDPDQGASGRHRSQVVRRFGVPPTGRRASMRTRDVVGTPMGAPADGLCPETASVRHTATRTLCSDRSGFHAGEVDRVGNRTTTTTQPSMSTLPSAMQVVLYRRCRRSSSRRRPARRSRRVLMPASASRAKPCPSPRRRTVPPPRTWSFALNKADPRSRGHPVHDRPICVVLLPTVRPGDGCASSGITCRSLHQPPPLG